MVVCVKIIIVEEVRGVASRLPWHRLQLTNTENRLATCFILNVSSCKQRSTPAKTLAVCYGGFRCVRRSLLCPYLNLFLSSDQLKGDRPCYLKSLIQFTQP